MLKVAEWWPFFCLEFVANAIANVIRAGVWRLAVVQEYERMQ